MTHYRFQYAVAGTGKEITRAQAIEMLRTRTGNVTVRPYPGALPLYVTVSSGSGLRRDPQVQISGWGYQDPVIAQRYGAAVTEAASLAADVTKED